MITGPVAPATSTRPARTAARGGALAGCLSGCATAAATVSMVVGTALGFAWELAQPHHRATARLSTGDCTLDWWRAATGGARYRLTCEVDRASTVSDLKLLSGPRGVRLVESIEDVGQRPWEDQRPLAGEVVQLAPGRVFSYDGTLSLGPVPWVGPPATVQLSLTSEGRRHQLVAPE